MLDNLVDIFFAVLLVPIPVILAALVWFCFIAAINKLLCWLDPPPQIKEGDADLWPEMSPRFYVDRDLKGWIGKTLVLDMSK